VLLAVAATNAAAAFVVVIIVGLKLKRVQTRF